MEIGALVESGLALVPTFGGQPRSWRQKLLLASAALLLVSGLWQLAVHGIKSSQTNFYKRYGLASKLTKPTQQIANRATPINETTASGSLPATVPPSVQLIDESTEPLILGQMMNAARFGEQHWGALKKLWTAESGWNPAARNRSSGACGIPQALPCHKIPDLSLIGQIEWGLDYIARRYGNPTNAWYFWQRHHWY